MLLILFFAKIRHYFAAVRKSGAGIILEVPWRIIYMQQAGSKRKTNKTQNKSLCCFSRLRFRSFYRKNLEYTKISAFKETSVVTAT